MYGHFSVFPAIRFICTIANEAPRSKLRGMFKFSQLECGQKNVLLPAGAGGRHCPCRKFLRPVGTSLFPFSDRQPFGSSYSMPKKNLSTPSRFAHSRSLSSSPLTPIFEICQELWFEGIRRLCPFHPVSVCAHHANSDKRAEVVRIQPAPVCHAS